MLADRCTSEGGIRRMAIGAPFGNLNDEFAGLRRAQERTTFGVKRADETFVRKCGWRPDRGNPWFRGSGEAVAARLGRAPRILANVSAARSGGPAVQSCSRRGEAVRAQSRAQSRFRRDRFPGKCLILKIRRDVRVVEGARLESEAGEQHRVTPKRPNAHGISDFTLENDRAVCVRKLRYSSRFQA